MSADVTAVQASMAWRQFLPQCLCDGDTMEGLTSTLTDEEWDRRWGIGNEYAAPNLIAWSQDWVYFSFYNGDGLRVFRVPRHPETLRKA